MRNLPIMRYDDDDDGEMPHLRSVHDLFMRVEWQFLPFLAYHMFDFNICLVTLSIMALWTTGHKSSG